MRWCHGLGLSVLLLLAVPGALQAGVVIAPGWGLPVFEETFDGRGIDYGVWQVGDWANNANNEQQYYHPNQVEASDGSLKLRADRDPNWTYGKNYNSGLVRTWQEWSYGRFEARARLPYGQGFWPAIWLLPRDAAWPTGGEIDIMEARGDQPYGVSSAVHWGWDASSRQYRSQRYESGADFQAGYHDYAVEWEVGVVRFYVDGVNHYTLYEPDVGLPGTPKSLILNLAVGGDYSGPPDGSTPFPAEFDIDYVRVWQRPEIVAPPVSMIANPGFEEAGGALNDWQAFGDTIGNVASDYGTPRDGERSLKLFGQFNGEANYTGVFQNVPITGGLKLSAEAQTLTRSEDSIAGSDNEALMKLEFYSQAGAEYGSEHFLGESVVTIADGNSPEDAWSRHELEALTPSDTVEARVALVFAQPPAGDTGSVFVDSIMLSASLAGDFNADGVVDAADYTVLRDAEGGSSSESSYADWQAGYAATLPSSSAAVPEPASALLVLLAAAAGRLCQRRLSR